VLNALFLLDDCVVCFISVGSLDCFLPVFSESWANSRRCRFLVDLFTDHKRTVCKIFLCQQNGEFPISFSF
jgi:hypothetical protein